MMSEEKLYSKSRILFMEISLSLSHKLLNKEEIVLELCCQEKHLDHIKIVLIMVKDF
jgi:hypothetical protein